MHHDPAERYPDNRRFIGFVAGALRIALMERISGRASEASQPEHPHAAEAREARRSPPSGHWQSPRT